jgi:hypothetical protein
MAWYPVCTACTTVMPTRDHRDGTDGDGHSSALLVITLEDLERAMVSRVLTVLGSLEIPARAMPGDREVNASLHLSFSIPRDRVAEVVLALGNQGFRNLRVYEGGPARR